MAEADPLLYSAKNVPVPFFDVGACCDTGHWVRSVLDPVECLAFIDKIAGKVGG